MLKKFPPVHQNIKRFLHGGDYNPDQWLEYPEILEEDFRLMKAANCNTFTLNIFGWSAIEPLEGRYEFTWLDIMMDKLAEQGSHVILATPSGARPAWLSQKYPEVLRVDSNRQRILHGKRHNHCLTSPIYREKTKEINRVLAERYKNHPALIMWHISNEFGGECHCDLCQDAFRSWLKEKYHHDLAKLNHAWWTGFWSHKITDWQQIESPAPHGEDLVHGLNLDWKRFNTNQTIDFYRNEIEPLRELTPEVPITTNFMGDYPHMGPFIGLDYDKFSKEVDVVTWDSYPAWHNDFEKTWETAANTAFVHDLYRSLKDGQPFLIMENTPSLVNWHHVNKTKRPGMHLLASIQSIAHGSDSILYFQWRKGRGGSEKFHGAVVDHAGHEHNRVFREVAEVGSVLAKIPDILGTTFDAEVAIIYDWENQWVIDDTQGLKADQKDYIKTCQEHYYSFWKKGIPVDVISMERDLSKYKVVIAPMLYMIRPGVSERIEQFVAQGGSFITTYWSGIVNEHDLCFLGGFPGPLRKVLGIWSEEIDSLYDSETNQIQFKENNPLELEGIYQAFDYCDIIHAETAEVLAEYRYDFYQGMPAVTVNTFGNGKAYYIASRNHPEFQDDFYKKIMEKLKITPFLPGELPEGVNVQVRTNGEKDYLFLMNFSEKPQSIVLPPTQTFYNMKAEEEVSNILHLNKFDAVILSLKNAK